MQIEAISPKDSSAQISPLQPLILQLVSAEVGETDFFGEEVIFTAGLGVLLTVPKDGVGGASVGVDAATCLLLILSG